VGLGRFQRGPKCDICSRDRKRGWQEAVDMYWEPGEGETDGSRKDPPYDLLMGRNLWSQRPKVLKETYED
jgi:hypothetical protein